MIDLDCIANINAEPEIPAREIRRCPIFIVGITQRSGTNFLFDLLQLHPDCTMIESPLFEDYFLRYSGDLVRYAERLSGFWRDTWGLSDQTSSLQRALGEGLLGWLSIKKRGMAGRVVTKTPSAGVLPKLRAFFPDAPVIIIVRDGRAVVESAFRTFGKSREYWTRLWSWNARNVRDFDADSKSPERHLVVKYEDLFSNIEREMNRVFQFLELNPDTYSFPDAKELPIRGSSTNKGASDTVHWNPVPLNDRFQPLTRFNSWTPRMHARFNWLAKKEMEYLGYEIVRDHQRLMHVAENRIRDLGWILANKISRAVPRPMDSDLLR